MDTTLGELITDLDTSKITKSDKIAHIPYIDELINSLNKLNNMVGMTQVKNSVVDLMAFLIVNSHRKNETRGSVTDDHMCHVVITGGPGTGKTTLARILGEIWSYSGAIKPFPKPEEKSNNLAKGKLFKVRKESTSEKKENADHVLMSYYRDNFKTQQSIIENYKRKLEDISSNLDNINNMIINIRQDHSKDIFNGLITDLRKNFDAVLMKTIDDINVDLKINSRPEAKFIVAKKDDLVGEYSGHTAPKTKALLDSALGGVLFVDEFYNIHNDPEGKNKDSFGSEAMTMINEYMSLYAQYLVVIFAGYKDLVEKNAYQSQRGLERRITWRFDLSDYTPDELARIFEIQLNKHGWRLEPELGPSRVFEQNKDLLVSQAGDTERLVQFCKQIHDKKQLYSYLHNEDKLSASQDKIITGEILILGINKLRSLKGTKEKSEDSPSYFA